MKYFGHIIFLLLLNGSLTAQVKFEQERKIKAQGVPDTARNVVALLAPDYKISWYQEQRLEGISFEAKYRLDSRRYSVEFDQKGVLEDVEIELKWKEVPLPAAAAIEAHFDSTYLRYRPRKVQEQFSGSLPFIREQLQLLSVSTPDAASNDANNKTLVSNSGSELILRYEIVVQVRTEQGPALHEVLFNEQGRMLQTAVILLRNTDNLAY